MDNNRSNDTRMKRKKNKNVHKIRIPVVLGIAVAFLALFIFSLYYYILPKNIDHEVVVLPQKTVSVEIKAKQSAFPVPTKNSKSITKQMPEPTIDSREPYTFIWMTDTQYYSKSYPEIFSSMTQWIVDNQKKLNIRYMIHTGDIVDSKNEPGQWENAKKALGILYGKTPYLTVAGNHDIGGSNQDYSAYQDLLDSQKLETLSTFGSSYQNGQGRYDLLDIYNDSYIFMSMGYNVSQTEIDWMNDILKQYASRTAILCVHSYMNLDGSLTSDGEKLYTQVVVPNANVKFVLCGHRHGVNQYVEELDNNGDGITDRKVYQLIANYQVEPMGGGGYLTILTVDTKKREISFTSYSPYLKDYIYFDETPTLEAFTIPMDF